ncbi:MAG: alpha/beta hydrolase [Beijerinckiaceae bacterium]|nr:alpha/beta hydrolase [Beijerinckiaceae bacterium]
MGAQPTLIQIDEGASVSGLLMAPPRARSIFVFAHGAGADMSHVFMDEMASALAQRDVATLRFNFPFMERAAGRGWSRPDTPAVAHAAVRAAVAHARAQAPGLDLYAGGKSFGARMTSQAAAERSLEGVRGLVFIGFPLHPAKKPSTMRGLHLKDVREPMLFIQGSRDALAESALIADVCASLPLATLHMIEAADHGFGVLVRSGRTHAQVMAEAADSVASFIAGQVR